MKLLLDTCAILWLAASPDRLSPASRQAIAQDPATLFVSAISAAISAFEISLKHRKGRLDLGMEPAEWWARAVAHHGLIVLPVTDEIALASIALPALHADPCDRIIVATGDVHTASIVTSDGLVRQYPSANVIW